MYREQMQQNKKILQEKINQLTKQLKDYPDGKLICCRGNNKFNWYHSIPGSKNYIPKAQKEFASQLAYKQYLLLQLQELETEMKAIESYFKKYPSNNTLNTFHSHPEIQNLLSDYISSNDKHLYQWVNEPFEKNTKHQEKLIYKTASGNTFRSKSESIIALCLEKYHIPYRYECALYLDDIQLFPDFTIYHPKTGKIFYWEHFGLMDQADYIKNVYSKLSLYSANGIHPTIHLITTFESQKDPLDISLVESLIQYHFLDS